MRWSWKSFTIAALCLGWATSLSGCRFRILGEESAACAATSAPSLAPASLNFITGEEITFQSGLDSAAYKILSGGGAIGAATGDFTAPSSRDMTVIQVADPCTGLATSASFRTLEFANVDLYNWTGTELTEAMGMAEDPDTGAVYVVGNGRDAGGQRNWLIRKSTDLGDTWGAAQAFKYLATHTYGQGVAAKSGGIVVTVGFGAGYWLARQSTNSGSSWATTDAYQLAAGYGASASDSVLDSFGDFYAVGRATDSSSISHWIVRKSSDDGASWTTVDDFSYAPGQACSASVALATSGGDIYVGGSCDDSGGLNHAVVRKSSDRGASWVTVDAFDLSGTGTYIGALAVSGGGVLYSTVYNPSGSVVIRRKRADNSWLTVSTVSLSGYVTERDSFLAFDEHGSMYLSVYARPPAGTTSYSVLAKSNDGGTSWKVIREVTDPDWNSDVVPEDILVHSTGAIFFSFWEWGGWSPQWVVERLN